MFSVTPNAILALCLLIAVIVVGLCLLRCLGLIEFRALFLSGRFSGPPARHRRRRKRPPR